MSRDREPRWMGFLAAGLILVFVTQAWMESRVKSVTSDEPPHIAAGLSYIQKGVFRANLQHPPLIKELAALSLTIGGVRLPQSREAVQMLSEMPKPGRAPEWIVGQQILTGNGMDRVLAWARAPMLLVSAFLMAMLFLWGRELVGAWAAVAAVFLCTMDPTILGHSYLLTTDIGVTAFMLAFLFALWRYARNPSRGRLVWCGVAMGAMLCAKFSAVLIVPVAAILLAASKMRRPGGEQASGPTVPKAGRNEACPCGSGKKYKACHGREAGRKADVAAAPGIIGVARECAGPFLAICAISLAVMEVAYLFGNGPGLYLEGIRQINADHNPNYLMYMAGELQRRFFTYFAAAWLLKEPIAGIVLTGIGLFALVRSRRISGLAKLFLLAPPAAIFLGATFLADDLGIRYIMPALPFGHLLGGLGLVTLVEKGSKWALAAAALLCCWVLVASFGVYPDRLPYFNESACLIGSPGLTGLDGGTRCGPDWLDDSNVDWNQSTRQFKAWLDAHAPDRPVVWASPYTTSFPPGPYGIHATNAESRDLMGEPKPGLYAVSASVVARFSAYKNLGIWLKRIRPVAIAGHSIYIYDIR